MSWRGRKLGFVETDRHTHRVDVADRAGRRVAIRTDLAPEPFARAQRVYEPETMERNQPVLEYTIVMPFPETKAPEEDGTGNE